MTNHPAPRARYGGAFWRAHHEAWKRSDLNQREYCVSQGGSLKAFGNWREKFKAEDPAPTGKLLYRRGRGLRHMSKHMLKEIPSAPSSYIPSARSGGSGRRRNFGKADKRRIVEETCREGASVSGVARRYGIATRLLFSWKQELAPTAKTETAFLPVTIMDVPDQSAETPPSLIATAKLNDVEPFTYLGDILQRMTAGQPVNRLDDLLPWSWSPTSVNP